LGFGDGAVDTRFELFFEGGIGGRGGREGGSEVGLIGPVIALCGEGEGEVVWEGRWVVHYWVWKCDHD
jgi:hypothetical protein